jgi:hypothetical protein
MSAPELYHIRVAGYLGRSRAARFAGLSLRHEPGGETVLSGMLDQAALHEVPMTMRDLGLKHSSVNRTGTAGSSHDIHLTSAQPVSAGNTSYINEFLTIPVDPFIAFCCLLASPVLYRPAEPQQDSFSAVEVGFSCGCSGRGLSPQWPLQSVV